jgi:hypothetical protein
MKSKIDVVFVRHGKTNNTNVFPDITPEGNSEVLDLAQSELLQWRNTKNIHNDNIILLSSPADCALGTIDSIRCELGYTARITSTMDLRPMDHRSPTRSKPAFMALPSGYIAYEDEPIFRDMTLFETVDECAIRARLFLKWMPGLIAREQKSAAIIVSHYEILSAYLRDFFYYNPSSEGALKNAEPIYASFSYMKDDVRVRFTFRGIETEEFTL